MPRRTLRSEFRVVNALRAEAAPFPIDANFIPPLEARLPRRESSDRSQQSLRAGATRLSTTGRNSPTRRAAPPEFRDFAARGPISGYHSGNDRRRTPCGPTAWESLMSLNDDAITVYKHLVTVVRRGKVTTTGAVSVATGVPMGLRGCHMAEVLAHLFLLSDERQIPPITAVVVKRQSEYDYNEHGSVGSAYLSAEAQSPNRAARYRSDSFAATVAAGRKKFDGYAVVREFREMIERHQDSVWAHAHWPAEICAPDRAHSALRT